MLDSANGKASNYSLADSQGVAAEITPRTVSLSAAKTYDGTAALTGTQLTITTGVGAETLTYSGALANSANVAEAAYVASLRLDNGTGANGGLASKHILPSLTATSDANHVTISPVTINILSGVKALDKVYDGTKAAQLDFSNAEFEGLIGTQAPSFTYLAEFDSANAGTDKTVTVKSLTIAETVSSNYRLTSSDGALRLTGLTIRPRALTITAPAITTKIYDGTTSLGSLGVGALKGLVNDETLEVSGIMPDLAVKDVGRYTTTVRYKLGNGANGGLATNYSLAESRPVTFDILPRVLTLSATKTYDGTARLSGTQLTITTGVGAETLTYSDATANSANVAEAGYINGITLFNGENGGKVSNYALPAPTASSHNQVTILPAPITGITGLAVAPKSYDGLLDATLDTGHAVFAGRIGSDVLALRYAAARFDSADAGTGKAVRVSGLGLAGAGAGNYQLQLANDVLTLTGQTITPRALTIGAPTIAARAYDGTQRAGALTLGTLGGLVNGETLVVSGAAADLAGKDVSRYATRVSYALADGANGGKASNYRLDPTLEVAAQIVPRVVSLVGAKTYDGTAGLGDGQLVITTGVDGETLRYSGATANSANVADAHYVSALQLRDGEKGERAANYALPSLTGASTANQVVFARAALTVTGDTRSVPYDGQVQRNAFRITAGRLYGADTIDRVDGLGSGIEVGTYADRLTRAIGTGLENYQIAFVNGALTITPVAPDGGPGEVPASLAEQAAVLARIQPTASGYRVCKTYRWLPLGAPSIRKRILGEAQGGADATYDFLSHRNVECVSY